MGEENLIRLTMGHRVRDRKATIYGARNGIQVMKSMRKIEKKHIEGSKTNAKRKRYSFE